MDEDPLVFLQNCSKEDIMTFLKWLHDNYRIKKLDSSHEYKRIFLMLYRRCVGHSLHAKIASQLSISKGVSRETAGATPEGHSWQSLAGRVICLSHSKAVCIKGLSLTCIVVVPTRYGQWHG